MDHQDIGVARYTGGLTTGCEHVQTEGRGRVVTRRAHDTVGHEHVGLAIGQVVGEGQAGDDVLGAGAVTWCDTDLQVNACRQVDEGGGGAEGEVIDGWCCATVDVHVDHGSGRIGAVVDDLYAGLRPRFVAGQHACC